MIFCHSSSIRSPLAVEAIDLTSRESVLDFTAWRLSIKCSTDTTASRLAVRSSVLKELSREFFLASSERRVLISSRLCLTNLISSSISRLCSPSISSWSDCARSCCEGCEGCSCGRYSMAAELPLNSLSLAVSSHELYVISPSRQDTWQKFWHAVSPHLTGFSCFFIA